MTADQIKILYVYSLYTSEKHLTYLQYTAALALFYYLMRNGYFPDYEHQLLLYDYKDTRRYVWEDKQFMSDINIIRDRDLLRRSRVKTADYRDINAHQCTQNGDALIQSLQGEHADIFSSIRAQLICSRCGTLLQILLHSDAPHLICPDECTDTTIQGFLSETRSTIDHPFTPAFL